MHAFISTPSRYPRNKSLRPHLCIYQYHTVLLSVSETNLSTKHCPWRTGNLSENWSRVLPCWPVRVPRGPIVGRRLGRRLWCKISNRLQRDAKNELSAQYSHANSLSHPHPRRSFFLKTRDNLYAFHSMFIAWYVDLWYHVIITWRCARSMVRFSFLRFWPVVTIILILPVYLTFQFQL